LIRVLALDTSTHTGWAHDNDAGNGPNWGTFNLPGWRPADVDKSGAALIEFVKVTVARKHITHVVIERPFTVYGHAADRKNPDLAAALMAFASVCGAAAVYAGIDAKNVRVVSPSSVRKHFIDNGRHPEAKMAVMRRCRALGWKIDNDNEADALACWDYAKSILDPGWAARSTPLWGQQHDKQAGD